jgi:hypothetical protein
MAVRLIEKAGGTDKVLSEANRAFERRGGKNMLFFSESEKEEYPAMSALGDLTGIWPDNFNMPDRIQIRLGDHFHTQFFLILNTNDTLKARAGLAQLNPRIWLTVDK